MVLGKLLKALKGGPPARLLVRGTITETGRHQPRTHLGPQQASEEAYFALDVAAAETTDGKQLSATSILPAEFSGPVGLLERFAVGDCCSAPVSFTW